MSDNADYIIECPACGKNMHKIFMSDAGVHLDVCLDGCGGIYFDNREFNKFDEKHEDITELEKAFENKTFKEVDESLIRVCPVCGTNMVKNYASSKHIVQVDECYSCGGKFLDHGELEKIRAQYNTEQERAADVLKELKQSMPSSYQVSEFQEKYQNVINRKPLKQSPLKKLYNWLFNK